MRTLLVLLLLALPLRAETLEEFIQKDLEKYQVPGASVGLVEGDRVVMLRGFGVRKQGGAEPVDPDTVFQLASVTKVFTAVSCGVAVDDGKLGWEQPATEVLTDLRLNQDYPTLHVTVSDFLSHRSGLPAFTGDLFDNLGYSREEVIRRLVHMPLSAGFREHAAYSNVGFFYAGMIAARAEGTTWEELVQRRVLTPLGMTRTLFRPHTADLAIPTLGGKPLAQFDEQNVLGPAGEMYSSASDMVRLLQMFLRGGGPVLKPESVRTILTPIMATEPEFSEMPPIFPESNFGYALGWGCYTYNGWQVFEKGGARAGARTLVMLVPEKKLGLVVLCNQNLTAFPESVRARVLEDALGPSRHPLQDLIWQAQQKIDKMMAGVPLTAPQPPKVTLPSPVPLARYVGVYTNPLYGRLRVTQQGDHLTWQVGEKRYGGPLYLEGATTFLMAVPLGGLTVPGEATFVLDETGKVLSVQTEYGVFTP